MIPVRHAILISGSPRRRDLLMAFVPDLKVVRPSVRERTVRTRKDLLANARLKFGSVKAPKADLVIAADTAVFLGRKVLGKPSSRDDARRMLRRLSGRWHTVTTAMVVEVAGKRDEATVTTRVHFRRLDQKIIDAYVATGEPMDKAGAYGIQGMGGLLVDKIQGDYFNVVGLPLHRLESILESNEYHLMNYCEEK
jgi:septum formation protein